MTVETAKTRQKSKGKKVKPNKKSTFTWKEGLAWFIKNAPKKKEK